MEFTEREKHVMRYALWMMSSAARSRAMETAQKTYRGQQEDYKKFLDDAAEAERLMHRLAS